MSKRVYLDWNASAPLRPEARSAMVAALEEVGNPASVHAEGRRVHALIEAARDEVAALVGAKPERVIFTSGATEAANHAMVRKWYRPDRKDQAAGFDRCIVTAVEHDAILNGADNIDIAIDVDENGQLEMEGFWQELARLEDIDWEYEEDDPPFQREVDPEADGWLLIAAMLANNETGIVQPIAELKKALTENKRKTLLVCDAAQAAGRIPVDMAALGADALLLSGHKLGGPKGVGALVLNDPDVRPATLIAGGGQERGLRAGTQNVPGIVGFGAAAKAARERLPAMARVAALRDELQRRLTNLTPDAVVVGASARRLPNTICIASPGRSSEMLVIALDLEGIAVSAGAACSSGKVERSAVLAAMGLPDEISGSAIRISLGDTTSQGDIEHMIAAWAKVHARHSSKAPAKRRSPKPARNMRQSEG